MGNLKLLPCDHSDAPGILAGQRAAFGAPLEPFFDVLFPPTETEDKAVQRTLDWWIGDATARYMKVVDDQTGKIISAAKWCIYEEPLTEAHMSEELVVDWHDDRDTNEWSSHVIHWIHQYRYSKTKGGKCCVLDILSTHPDYQRRGAGAMLVKWGTDIADSLGLPAYIEGSFYAKRLYEKNGFVASPDWIVIPVPGKWKSRPTIKFFWFDRPAKVVDGKPLA